MPIPDYWQSRWRSYATVLEHLQEFLVCSYAPLFMFNKAVQNNDGIEFAGV